MSMCRHIGGIENHGLLKLHCAFLSFGPQHRCWRMRRWLSLFSLLLLFHRCCWNAMPLARVFFPHPPAPCRSCVVFLSLSFWCLFLAHLLVATTPWAWSPEGRSLGGRTSCALGSRKRMTGGHAWSRKAHAVRDDLGTLTVHSPLT